MGFDIYVQNMNQKMVESIFQPGESTLSDIVSGAPLGSLLDGIDTYSHTMFNSYQLKFFLKELASVVTKNSQEIELVTRLQAAAESAIRQHGYLLFVGD